MERILRAAFENEGNFTFIASSLCIKLSKSKLTTLLPFNKIFICNPVYVLKKVDSETPDKHLSTSSMPPAHHLILAAFLIPHWVSSVSVAGNSWSNEISLSLQFKQFAEGIKNF